MVDCDFMKALNCIELIMDSAAKSLYTESAVCVRKIARTQEGTTRERKK